MDTPPPAPPNVAPPATAPEPKASWLSSITREAIEKVLATMVGVLLGGALIFYLKEFKETQDAMQSVLAAEHGQAWARAAQADMTSMSKLYEKIGHLDERVTQLEASSKLATSKVGAICAWTEQVRGRMAKFGTEDRAGLANLTDNAQEPIIYVNKAHPLGGWYSRGDRVVITNHHNGASGPDYTGEVTSAYAFPRVHGEPEVLLQISKYVAKDHLHLPLTDGIFDVTIRKDRTVPVWPSVTEVETQQNLNTP